MQDGPITGRFRAIQDRVENCGRKLGIPEEQAVLIVAIDAKERLAEEIHSLHADEVRWHKEVGTLRDIWKKAIAYLAGELKKDG